MNDTIRNEMIDAVLTARDFCGNESSAIQMVADDFGIKLTSNDIVSVLEGANDLWDISRMESMK